MTPMNLVTCAAVVLLTAAQASTDYERGLAALHTGHWAEARSALEPLIEHDTRRCRVLFLLTIAASQQLDVEGTMTFGNRAWRCKPALDRSDARELKQLRSWAYGVQRGSTTNTVKLPMESGDRKRRDTISQSDGLDPKAVADYEQYTKDLQAAMRPTSGQQMREAIKDLINESTPPPVIPPPPDVRVR